MYLIQYSRWSNTNSFLVLLDSLSCLFGFFRPFCLWPSNVCVPRANLNLCEGAHKCRVPIITEKTIISPKRDVWKVWVCGANTETIVVEKRKMNRRPKRKYK